MTVVNKTMLMVGMLFSCEAFAQDAVSGTATAVDGDTLAFSEARVRLWGIDSPESSQTCNRDGTLERCGQKAAFALADLIGRKTVSCNVRDTDRYGRLVAICSVGGVEINRWLVAEGWAVDYTQYSKGAYKASEAEASAARKGIWGTEFVMPSAFRKTKKSS